MAEKLQAFVSDQNKKKKGSVLGMLSSTPTQPSDSASTSLLSWKPSVSISMPFILSKDSKKDSESWATAAKEDPCCPALSRKQRLIGFGCCILCGIFCFSLAAMYAPFLLIKARKFSLLYSLGSLFMINSFSFLWGPWNHMKHLMTVERLPFTTAYFGSLFLTLYFAMWMRNSILTTIAAVVQIIALLWYLVSYIPGGQTGLKFISKMFMSLCKKTVSKGITV